MPTPYRSFASVFIATLLSVATHSAAAQAYNESVLYNFCSQTNCADGSAPESNLIQASDGNLYGTTMSGGNSTGRGTIFKLTLSGSLTTLYSFCSLTNCSDGEYPDAAGLIQGTDGNFYGTAPTGGNDNDGSTNGNGTVGNGTIFKITPSGSLTTLYTFCSQTNCKDGINPGAALVQGKDGNFYGTTAGGGNLNDDRAYGNGTVFKITPSGTLTTLYSFCSQTNCTDGEYPSASLVQGTDGNFYGTTVQGGNENGSNSYGNGTVFKITPSGSLTTLYSFCSQPDCADGLSPDAGLVEGTDGNLYGTTYQGGNYNTDTPTGNGTVFKITPSGTFTTLYSFCSQANCLDGLYPTGLIEVSDGSFYGTTRLGGANYNSDLDQGGTAFKITPSGSLTTLYSFCTQLNCTDGNYPETGMVEGADGNFYGTTLQGGDVNGNSEGVFYELSADSTQKPPVQLSVSPSTVSAGSTFTLTYAVTNAGSDTMQYCFATNNAGNAVWGGVKTGKTTAQNASVTAPSLYGTYTYALTCGGVESGFATLVVKNTTTDSLTASPNPATVGQSVTLTATVTHSAGAATPTGTMNFSVGSTVIGSKSLNSSGIATFSASTNGLPSGSYPVVATYGGDGNYDASTSPATTVTLNKAPTATTLTASPNPVTPPLNVMLTATVAPSASGAAGIPTGTVTFYYQTTALGTVSLSNSGVATVSASSEGLGAGKYPITAKYNGDASDAASSSSAVTVTVK